MELQTSWSFDKNHKTSYAYGYDIVLPNMSKNCLSRDVQSTEHSKDVSCFIFVCFFKG